MIPAVLVAEESDPFAVRRGPGLRARFSPVGNAPEFFFGDFMNGLYRASRGVGDVDEILFEVFRLAVENQAIRIDPGEAAVFAGCADGYRLSAVQFEGVDLARSVFGNAIDEFGSGIRRRFIVMDNF